MLDESSILKSFTGKVRNQIIDFFSDTPFRLACTATPAPNDFMELGNHAEFLGIMSYSEMLSMFFVHDGGQTSKWRLKGHAEDVFWQWLGSWAVVMNSPADLGYDLPGYDLPPLRVHEVIVDGDAPITESMTLTQRREARRATLAERCQAAADLVNGDPGEQWLVWCDLNSESEALAHGIPDAVEVKGSDKASLKSSRLLSFSMGFSRALVTKPSIAGFGMNWQNCHKMILSVCPTVMSNIIRPCGAAGVLGSLSRWMCTSLSVPVRARSRPILSASRPIAIRCGLRWANRPAKSSKAVAKHLPPNNAL